jgi:hypothetical protein
MDQKDYVVIVSGLPRSGTSMMMKMLEAGGEQILTDKLREADANNPNGYYEFERVKKLKEGDFGWLPEAMGRTVKIVTGLVTYLPSQYKYKVIFMRRDINEVLSSQKKMLGRLGRPEDNISDEKMAKIYQEHLRTVEAWISKQANIEILYINYNTMVADPGESLQKVSAFLGGELDVEAMAGVVNKDLYRERKPASV